MTRSEAGWRSDEPDRPRPIAPRPADVGSTAPSRQRSEGRVELSVREERGHTVLVRSAESGSARMRLPRHAGPGASAVLINTAGGLAAGDRFSTGIAVAAGADLTVSTPAAEKVYRSDGDTTRVSVELEVGRGARLDWLPQETLLFDRARMARRLDITLASDARLLAFEATVFGRAARDEHVVRGFYEDRWRIRRDGRLIYADTFRLDGAIATRLARRTVAAGARAVATLISVAPDAAARIEDARALLEGAGSDCAAGAWNGLLAIRFLAPDIETLRRDAARVITGLAGRSLPRVWHL